MVYHKNFRPMPEPQFPKGPENPSTAVTLRFGELAFDRSFENRQTFELFRVNKRALIGGALKMGTSEEVPVTDQNLRDSLEKGKRFQDLFPPDGPPRPCGICFKEKQPVTTTYHYHKDGVEREGQGGNLFDRSELVIREGTKPETLRLANDLTAEIFGGEIPGSLYSRALHVCRECQYRVNKDAERKGKDKVFSRGFNFSQAKNRLLGTSERIAFSIAKNETKGYQSDIADNLGRQSRSSQTEGGRGGFRGRGRDDRPREERVEWNGALFFKSTAEKLQEAVSNGSLEDSLDALIALSPKEVFELGAVEFEGQAPHVQGIAISAKERLEKAAEVSRVSGTGTAPLGDVAAEHDRREKSPRGGRGKKKFSEPRRNPKHDYNR